MKEIIPIVWLCVMFAVGAVARYFSSVGDVTERIAQMMLFVIIFVITPIMGGVLAIHLLLKLRT